MKTLFSTLFVVSILVLAAAAIAARMGFFPVAATSTPASMEKGIAGSVLKASLARQASGLKNPLEPTSEVLLAGLKTFQNNCAGCHGNAKGPSHWGNDNFYPRVPQFGQHPPRLTSLEMFVATKHGIRYSGMGAWDGMMSDEEIWKVATFLEHLNSLPSDVRAAWQAP